MVYNYYFSVASVLFLLVIFFCDLSKLRDRTAQNFRFLRLAFGLLIASVTEVISTIMVANVNESNLTSNMFVNAFEFFAIAFTVYFYGLYIEGYIHEGKHIVKPMRWVNRVILFAYLFLLFSNNWTHWFFYFDSNYQYAHGILYHLVYVFPMYFVMYGTFQLAFHRKTLSFRQIASMLAFSVLIGGAATLQLLVFPNVLISLFSGCLGMIIIFYYLETPDYQILLNTMEELKKAEETAQEERVKAYAANQAKSSFLANVSHEIRTPINAVIGMNEMILREAGEENIKEYAMDVNAAGMQLLSIINDILDISKIEAGKMEVIPVEYELAVMIGDLVNMTEVRAREKGLEFEVKVDENLPSKLLGDDLRLKQIIVNLLTNGVKYTKEGKVTFRITGEKLNGELRLHICVEDTGVGIKDDDKENLFKAFHRLDERTNRTIEGTGLGMSIANELLGMMGSSIQFESTYGEGSKFYFDVIQPIIDETPVGNLEEVIKRNTKGYSHTINFTAPNARILVVDDNSINRKVVIGLLKEIGCTVDEAGGGYECLEKVKKRYYDLIFLDHLMPDLDGVGTMEKLKSEENLCMEVPVIAFTANAISGMRESFLATGFNGFLSKPISSDKLEEILLEFLPKDKIKEGKIEFCNQKEEKALPSLDDFDFRYAKLCLKKNDLIISVASEFYDSIDRIKNNLNDMVEKLNDELVISSYRTEVHSLKSTSRMLGEFTLSGLSKTAEDGAKEKDIEKILKVHPLVIAELERAKTELEAIVPKTEGIVQSEVSDEDLLKILEKLKEALSNRDVTAADSIAKELAGIKWPDNLENDMVQLLEFIKMIKMLKASVLVDQMIEKIGR